MFLTFMSENAVGRSDIDNIRRVHILVVEDERKLAQVLASALQAQHYDVVVAPTGEAGFFRTNAETFDLVVLDPPYAMGEPELESLLADLAARAAVAAGGLVVLTREIKSSIPVIPVDWRSYRRLSYGDAVVLVYRA